MTPELTYFIKVNIAFVILYGFYRLLFYRDTFFNLRRVTLLSFFLLAFSYPLFNIQDWIKSHDPIVEVIYAYSYILPDITVNAEATEASWTSILQAVGRLIYLTGIIVLLVRFFVQLFSILRIAYTGRRTKLNGITIYEPKEAAQPFSFFKLIFISPSQHSEKEIDEILTHEHTHAIQWHSIDVVLCELVTIICWINPFAWLLKREVRLNLEYLADNTVLKSGYDIKTYQYHLLGLANHKAAATIYNSFNVLDLKNRIIMMNKKQSHKVGMMKYFVFLPITALLMLLSNMEAVARIEVIPTESIPEFEVLLPEEAIAQQDTSTVFTMVETPPKFPGGDEKLMQFISQNINYPKDAQEAGVQGRVILSYVVNKDGSVSDIKVARSIHPSLDAEAIRVIKSMPEWTPGKQRGETVRVKYTIPITFSLNVRGEPSVNRLSGEQNLKQPQSPKEPADGVYTVVEVAPKFPGGENGVVKFITENINYPMDAKDAGLQGRVIVAFVVNEDGSLSNISVVRAIHPSLDAEAIRVVKAMPKWTPGEQRGKAVKVRYVLPVTFRL
jgi:TonB family C-terminal domain